MSLPYLRSEADYRALEPMYDTCRAQIPTWPCIDVQLVQRTYRFGYNRAARMLEHLAFLGVIHWDQISGRYTRAAAGGAAG